MSYDEGTHHQHYHPTTSFNSTTHRYRHMPSQVNTAVHMNRYQPTYHYDANHIDMMIRNLDYGQFAPNHNYSFVNNNNSHVFNNNHDGFYEGGVVAHKWTPHESVTHASKPAFDAKWKHGATAPPTSRARHGASSRSSAPSGELNLKSFCPSCVKPWKYCRCSNVRNRPAPAPYRKFVPPRMLRKKQQSPSSSSSATAASTSV